MSSVDALQHGGCTALVDPESTLRGGGPAHRQARRCQPRCPATNGQLRARGDHDADPCPEAITRESTGRDLLDASAPPAPTACTDRGLAFRSGKSRYAKQKPYLGSRRSGSRRPFSSRTEPRVSGPRTFP